MITLDLSRVQRIQEMEIFLTNDLLDERELSS